MRKGLGRTGVVVCSIFTIWGQSASAQATWELAGGATLEQINVRSAYVGGSERLHAAGFGLHAGIRRGRLAVDVSYKHANLVPSGLGVQRNMSEGELNVRAVLTPWFSLATGVHERRYDTPLGDQRWLAWVLGVRGEASVFEDRISGFAELEYALAGSVNVAEQWSRGVGSSAGIHARLPWDPFGILLAYRLDYVTLGGGARAETVDGLTFGMTFVLK